jgi:methionine-rich copper-binding protein CopC
MNKYIAAATLVTGLIVAGSCFAHAHLESSTPANDATVTEAPKSVTLNFSEAAHLVSLKVSAGDAKSEVPVDKAAKAAKSVTVSLPALKAGTYTVEWSALADDGHPSKGHFTFTIKG